MKPSSVLPAAGGVTCLSNVMLHGIRYLPGDSIPPGAWEAVPAKNRASPLAVGTVTEDPGDIDEAVSASHTQRRAALDEAATVSDLLAQILADIDAAAQQVADLEKAHKANGLNDYRATAGRGSTKTPQLAAARDRLESLNAAGLQAIEEAARLEKKAEKLARQAEGARARMIMEKRRLVCVEVQNGIEALVPVFVQYHALALQFRQLLRDTGNQVCSQWRIENLVHEKLFGRAISKDLRIPDLAAIDTRIFEGVLDRAMKELEKQD